MADVSTLRWGNTALSDKRRPCWCLPVAKYLFALRYVWNWKSYVDSRDNDFTLRRFVKKQSFLLPSSVSASKPPDVQTSRASSEEASLCVLSDQLSQGNELCSPQSHSDRIASLILCQWKDGVFSDWSQGHLTPTPPRSCPVTVRTLPHLGPRQGPARPPHLAGAQTSAEALGYNTGQVGSCRKLYDAALLLL